MKRFKIRINLSFHLLNDFSFNDEQIEPFLNRCLSMLFVQIKHDIIDRVRSVLVVQILEDSRLGIGRHGWVI